MKFYNHADKMSKRIERQRYQNSIDKTEEILTDMLGQNDKELKENK